MQLSKRLAVRTAAVATTALLGVALSSATAHADTYIGGSVKIDHCWGELYSDSSTSSPNNWAYGNVTDSSGPYVNHECRVEVVQRKVIGTSVSYYYTGWYDMYTPSVYHNDNVHMIEVCIWDMGTGGTACSNWQS